MSHCHGLLRFLYRTELSFVICHNCASAMSAVRKRFCFRPHGGTGGSSSQEAFRIFIDSWLVATHHSYIFIYVLLIWHGRQVWSMHYNVLTLTMKYAWDLFNTIIYSSRALCFTWGGCCCCCLLCKFASNQCSTRTNPFRRLLLLSLSFTWVHVHASRGSFEFCDVIIAHTGHLFCEMFCF